jgi:hypothetical protein
MQGGRRACYPATVRSGRKRAPVCAAACPRVAGSDASSSVNAVLVSCDEVREPWHVTHDTLSPDALSSSLPLSVGLG